MQRVVAFLLAGIVSASAQPKEKPLWLDAEPKQWNKPGAGIPRARKSFGDFDDEFTKQCRSSIRANTELADERAVAAKGWQIFHVERNVQSGESVVSALQDFDGMCRPMRYQDFVFVNGTYAGTLSPVLMDSRTDGSSSRVAFPSPGKLTTEFLRYAIRDPLCCPSRISEVAFEIRDVGGKPVVALVSVRTRPTN
jgi:hypothetical protein